MAFRRSSQFNADIDPNLLKWIEAASGQYTGPYDVEVFSGYRPGDRRQHGKRGSGAVDLRLIDPKTGKELENYQDPKNFGEYQKVANLVRQQQMAQNADYNERLRWGGYFGGGAGKYGALDLMHFDVGGGNGLGMAGGGWDTGLNEAQAKQWGLTPGGGVAAAGGGNQIGPYSVDQQQNAILRAIRQMEAGGEYNKIYGGRTFTGNAHPNVRVPINGPAGDYSTAAGGYQFTYPTWQEYAEKAGVKDFSPESQDKAAWALALSELGGEAGLAGSGEEIAAKLGGRWEALKKDPKKFASLYNEYLGGKQAAPGTGVALTPSSPASTSPAVEAAKAKKPKSFSDYIADMAENFGGGASTGGGGGAASSPLLPVTALPSTASAPVSSINPEAAAMQRQQLAQAVARLNSGKLYG